MPDTDEREARAERLAAIERLRAKNGYENYDATHDIAWLLAELRTADAALSALRAREEEAEKDARRWRVVRPWLHVDHVYDAGRLGFAPKSIARLALGSGLNTPPHALFIETPDNGRHAPRYTVEQVVDSVRSAAARALQENDR